MSRRLPHGTLSNEAALRAAGPILTADLEDGGLFTPEQSKEFFLLAFEEDEFGSQHRVELRKARTGEIDRLFIQPRQMRRRTENVDSGFRAKPSHSKVEYSLQGTTIPFEITEESLNYNIEEEGYEDTVVARFAERFGLDAIDLGFNGDTAFVGDDSDFLNTKDGWLKEITANGNNTDGSGTNSGNIHHDHFFKAVESLPERHRSRLNKMAWVGSMNLQVNYMKFLAKRATTGGDASLGGQGPWKTPLGLPWISTPSLFNAGDGTNETMLLVDPRNLITVMRNEVIIRSTAEGRQAVMQNKRFYAIHADVDFIIEEVEAVAQVTDLNHSTPFS